MQPDHYVLSVLCSQVNACKERAADRKIRPPRSRPLAFYEYCGTICGPPVSKSQIKLSMAVHEATAVMALEGF